MWLCISGRQIDHFGMLTANSITSWGGRCSGQRWRRLWRRRSVSVGYRCTCTVWHPACLRILHCALEAWQESGCVDLMKHCVVCFYRSRHHLSRGNSAAHSCSSRISFQGSSIKYCVSFTGARENPPLAILAIFKPRCVSDCSSCTRPPCLPIVAEMLKTYKTLVATSNNEIRLLPQPYMLP